MNNKATTTNAAREAGQNITSCTCDFCVPIDILQSAGYDEPVLVCRECGAQFEEPRPVRFL